MIVGFPGETEESFQKTVDLIQKVKPDIVNITRFSARPGTKAKNMKGRIKTEIVKQRSKLLTNIFSNISLELNSSQFSLEETILGFGQLNPRFPNQSIILSFQKPEGTIHKLISKTSKNGYFNFSYEPELLGDWIINTNWISEKSYYTSAKGDPIQISVVSTNQLDSIDETMLSLILIIILVIVIGIIILFKKRRNKKS